MAFEEPYDEKSCSLIYVKKGWFGMGLEVKIEGSKEAILEFAAKHLPDLTVKKGIV